MGMLGMLVKNTNIGTPTWTHSPLPVLFTGKHLTRVVRKSTQKARKHQQDWRQKRL
ncbi:hypothetical protein KK083_05110 [Fulvivirgaceae bacterium PWU4]|uniref:Uncharacterized protein n=1 Tax=Chryseosolibacter histidini TaxID=2782349 RepID=A0AAP2DJ92_9BACT|nr:hypothetical protein [Chryseosolibacter histidini]MBT1696242.1 hypothetical protein [Chryseosolibacter histidini]